MTLPRCEGNLKPGTFSPYNPTRINCPNSLAMATMSDSHSVSQWINQLKNGNDRAANEIWRRYFEKLCRMALRKLYGATRRAANEEDVALSAFDSLCRGAQQGRFPKLTNRDDLWQLLLMITERKAANLVQHERRQKRDVSKLESESDHNSQDSEGSGRSLDRIPGSDLAPDLASQMAEEFSRLIKLLDDESLQMVAMWKMEGYRNEEIAANIGCNARTIERKLQRIRTIWTSAGVV
jgi:DNA-directed RNA polymerase specialized sigma24 family protein